LIDRTRVAEYRFAEARAEMERAGLDGLLMIASTNLCFLSGYPYVDTNLARPFFLLLPRREAPALLVHTGRQYEARANSWVDDVRLYERLSVAPVAELDRLLRDRGLRGRRIGAELGFEQRMGLPFAEFERIRAELAPTEFVDAADVFWRLRIVKPPWDLDSLRAACKITADAYEATFAATHGGHEEREVLQRLAIEHMRRGGGHGWGVITSGPGNYDAVLGQGTERILGRADMVWMDGGCSVNGLWSDFGRGGVIGEVSSEQRDLQRLVHEITLEGVALLKPGVPLREIAAHVNARVAAIGVPVTSRISTIAGRVGHGVGFETTEPPHVSEEDTTIVAPGMVITMEPGVAAECGIFHVEENVIVTESGPEVISLAPWELRTLPVA
jgi:Xaa-Pro aminopeptidase